jgi:hypothetical protein
MVGVVQQFQTRFRYSATGFSYNMTAVLGGGVAPLAAPLIIASDGTLALGVFLAILAGIQIGVAIPESSARIHVVTAPRPAHVAVES